LQELPPESDTAGVQWWQQKPLRDLLRVIVLAVCVVVALTALHHL